MNELELISIGKLTKTHALKGALKMRPFNIHTDFFNHTDKIYLENQKEYKIERIRLQNGNFIIELQGIKTITQAQEIVGKTIYIEKSVIPIEDDEILLNDMIGFDVIFNDEKIGEVFNFADYNAGLIYIVKTPSGKIYYLPDQKDFIENIDYDNKKIIFKDIEELLD